MNKVDTISINQRVSQVEGNIVSDMDGEKVMLSVANGKYYNFGVLGGEIWSEIKEAITIQALITKLVGRYDVTEKECEEQTMAFLNQLAAEGLIRLDE
ncbi:lasso peptide biosynthesis PqqD family chaperone [Paraliobacillus sediminis]|uniref:lasso peptide biosynthesis PqqD family chaperone n=1 Tax=Paraliobacillus sediminis TaxID=1885916 RepID=UPI000E3C5CBA|nr:lasso peptide biosynthesis PqqD family chaperone [Paraliobacillus sediminis]